MEVRKKKIFYSEDEALDCQAQHEGAEMDFRVGHGTMLNGKWTYEIPENRPSWTVSWTVPVSVAVEVSGGLVQAGELALANSWPLAGFGATWRSQRQESPRPCP